MKKNNNQACTVHYTYVCKIKMKKKMNRVVQNI